MASNILSAGLGLWQSKQEGDAQRRAQREAEEAQRRRDQEVLAANEKARRDSAARTAGAIRQRDYAGDSTASRLRGIQATMLASRKAANADAGGKSKLGE